MKKLIGSLAVAALIITGAQLLRRHQNKTLVSPAERQTLRDAPNNNNLTYELVGDNARPIAPVPNSKRVACTTLDNIDMFPSVLLTVNASEQVDPCKLFDQLGVNFPWKELESSLYGKKPNACPREEPSGYPMLYARKDFSDKYGGHWEVGVDPDYVAQGVNVRDKFIVIDKAWKFRHMVSGHPNYKVVANGGQIVFVILEKVDNNQHMPLDMRPKKAHEPLVDQSRVQKMLDRGRNIFGGPTDSPSPAIDPRTQNCLNTYGHGPVNGEYWFNCCDMAFSLDEAGRQSCYRAFQK